MSTQAAVSDTVQAHEHDVSATEMQHLKALVHAEDPNAFMIVTPALEIIGRGFQPMVV